jgi:hypothetical protein
MNRVNKIAASQTVLHLYYVMRCQWDEEKNQANQEKHDGLDFETAALVFEDPEYILVEDRVDVSGEQRYHAIGQVEFGEGSRGPAGSGTCVPKGKEEWQRNHPYHLGPRSGQTRAPNLSSKKP